MWVIECLEVWKEDGDDCTFDHYSVVLTRGTEVLITQSPRAFAIHWDLDISDLCCPPVRISAEDRWPPVEDDITLAPSPVPNGTFQKEPSLYDYNPQTSIVKPRERLLHEAHICEVLKQFPHKNIAAYLRNGVKGREPVILGWGPAVRRPVERHLYSSGHGNQLCVLRLAVSWDLSCLP